VVVWAAAVVAWVAAVWVVVWAAAAVVWVVAVWAVAVWVAVVVWVAVWVVVRSLSLLPLLNKVKAPIASRKKK
jgi:hypothetical protein